MTDQEKLLLLLEEIKQEMTNVSQNILSLDDADLTEPVYRNYSNQLDDIKRKFDDAGDIAKKLKPNPSDPDFYQLLLAKQELDESFGSFHRLHRALKRRYEKANGISRDEIQRERIAFTEAPEPAETEEEVPAEESEVILEEEFDPYLEEALLEEELKEEKAAEKKARQEKLSAKAKLQERRRAEDRARQEEADRIAAQSQGRQQEEAAYRAQRQAEEQARLEENNRLAESQRWEQQQSESSTVTDGSGYAYTEPLNDEQRLRDYELRQEEARRLDMNVREGKEFSEADLRDEKYRQEEERILAEQKLQERMQRESDAVAAYHKKMDDSLKSDMGTSHIDFSDEYNKERERQRESFAQKEDTSSEQFRQEPGVGYGSFSQSSDFGYSPTPFVYTPFGAVPHEAYQYAEAEQNLQSNNNAKIYSSLATNRDLPEDQQKTFYLTPQDEFQMRHNLETAQQEYLSKKGTPEEAAAAQVYYEQRDVLRKVDEEIKAGKIILQQDITASQLQKESLLQSRKEPDNSYTEIFTSYTPTGAVGTAIVNGRLSGSSYETVRPTEPSHVVYTKDNPLRVTPEYDRLMLSKMEQAQAAMKNMPLSQDGNPLIHSQDLRSDLIMARESYLGYQQAKKEGRVLVDAQAEKRVPEMKYWQEMHQGNVLREKLNREVKSSAGNGPGNGFGNGPKNNASGTTLRDNMANPNNQNRFFTKEVAEDVWGRDSKLKRKSAMKYYLKSAGTGLERGASQAATSLGYKVYHMVQNGDDDASGTLRTFEKGRYYASVGIGTVGAITHAAPVFRAAHAGKHFARQEFKLYGNLTELSDKQLSAELIRGKQRGLSQKKEIKALIAKGKNLSPEERIQLASLMAKHTKDSADLRTKFGYQKLSKKHNLELETAQNLKKGKRFVTQKDIDAEILKVKKEYESIIQKKYSHLSGKTPESIKKEIKDLKKISKAKKAEIKGLKGKSKTAALSSVENAKLKSLLTDKAKIDKDLRQLFGYQRIKGEMDEKIEILSRFKRRLYKNKIARSNSLFLVSNLFLRPIDEGSDIGAQGLSRMYRLTSNRYARALMKKGLKFSFLTAKATTNLVVPGSVQYMEQSMRLMKQMVSVNVNAKYSLGKRKIKTAVNSAARLGKRTLVNVTPEKVRTAVSGTRNLFLSSKRYLLNRMAKAKRWVANTKLIRGIASVRRAASSVSYAISFATNILKSVAIKAFAAFMLFFLGIGIISVVVTSVVPAIGTTVIASPDSDDNKIDLTAYIDFIERNRVEIETDITDFLDEQVQDELDIVEIEYGPGVLDNTREMISMMAVRLGQDLDYNDNPEVKNYIDSLYKDSHKWEHKIVLYSCPGCETREIRTEYVDANGNVIVDHYTEEYCPGDHKRITITITVHGFDQIFWEDNYANAGFTVGEGGFIGHFEITHYCACESCCGKTDGITASGVKAKANRTIAVDPTVIPLGSSVVINGKRYVAEDTGSAIKGNRIDIYVDSHDKALQLGRLYNVAVYNPSYAGGSIQETGVWEGWTDDNIEWCKVIYNLDWNDLYSGYAGYNGIILGGGYNGSGGIGGGGIFGGAPDLEIEGDVCWPLTSGTVTCEFGYRNHPVTGAADYHKGIDIGVPTGTPIYAATDGKIVTATYHSEAGNYIRLEGPDGVSTRYLHCNNLVVSAGDTVKAGQVIGYSGNTGTSTGPHLHFEVLVNNTPVNPRNYFDIP